MKAVIFDFWGTLVENGVWSPIKQVRNILDVRMPFPEYVIRMERAMMTKEHPTLKDAFVEVAKEFSITPDEKQLDELVGMWNKSWMLAQPYAETVEVLQELQKEYTLILISNTDCFSIPKVLEKFDLAKYFESVNLSCKKGFIKTDKNFLKTILDEQGLQVEDCVLVGDSIQSDMSSAKKVGMKAILLDRKDSRDFEEKIKNLRDLKSKL